MIQKFLKKKGSSGAKFQTDLLWNIGSLGGIGIIGILINVLIWFTYGADALGVYALVYTIYLMLSQIAVGGVHLSIQAFTPEFAENRKETDGILNASLLLVIVYSLATIGTCWLLQEEPAKWFQSPQVSEALPLVLGGLLFFSLNKQFVAFHNACRRMKVVAVFQFLRFLFMISTLTVFIQLEVEAWMLPSILAIAEAALFLVVLAYSLRFFTIRFDATTTAWVKKHNSFGNRALIGNLLFNMTTKVDIFMLGIFLSDSAVGIYNFAATIAEGVMQFPMVFRNNINPIITKAHLKHNPDFFNYIMRKNVKAFYKIIAPLCLLTIAGFPVVLLVFGIEEDFYLIWSLYAILVAGIVLAAGYLPFQMFFNQVGRASAQSLYIFFFFLSNVLFNWLFIELYGLYGAAMGTFLAYVAQAFILKLMVRNQTPYRL